MPDKKFYDDIRESVKKSEEEATKPNAIPIGQRRDVTVVGNSLAPGLGRGITKIAGPAMTQQRKAIVVIAGSDELQAGKGVQSDSDPGLPIRWPRS